MVARVPKRPKYKIENVVASVEVDAKIDLNLLARKQRDAEYNPEQFPGLMLRVKNPKATILVFNSGRMVITGLRRESEAEKAVENVIAKIRRAGITVSGTPKITIQNIKNKKSIFLNEKFSILKALGQFEQIDDDSEYKLNKPLNLSYFFMKGNSNLLNDFLLMQNIKNNDLRFRFN